MRDSPVVVGWSSCRERLTRRAGGIPLASSPCTLAPDHPSFFFSCWSKARSGDSSGKQQPCGWFAHEGLWLNHLTASPFRRHKQTRLSHAAVPLTAAPVLPRRSLPPSWELWEGPAESPGGVVDPEAPSMGAGRAAEPVMPGRTAIAANCFLFRSEKNQFVCAVRAWHTKVVPAGSLHHRSLAFCQGQ